MTIKESEIIIKRKQVELVTMLIPRDRKTEHFKEAYDQLRDEGRQSIRGRSITVDGVQYYEMAWVMESEVGLGSEHLENFHEMADYLDSIEE